MIGHRAWRLLAVREKDAKEQEWGPWDFMLASLVMHFLWPYPVMRSKYPTASLDRTQLILRCRRGPLGSTAAHQPDGFWFFKNQKQTENYENTLSVFGVCSLFGRVIEHENGYRAQNCRIDELHVPIVPRALIPPYSVKMPIGGTNVSVRMYRGLRSMRRHPVCGWIFEDELNPLGRTAVLRVAGRHYEFSAVSLRVYETDNSFDAVAKSLSSRYQCDVLPAPYTGRRPL